MRFGRWHSDAVRAYLWGQGELQRDLSALMVVSAKPSASALVRRVSVPRPSDDDRVDAEVPCGPDGVPRVAFCDSVSCRDTDGAVTVEAIRRDPPSALSSRRRGRDRPSGTRASGGTWDLTLITRF